MHTFNMLYAILKTNSCICDFTIRKHVYFRECVPPTKKTYLFNIIEEMQNKITLLGQRKKMKTIFFFRNKFKYHSYEYNERFSFDNITKYYILAMLEVDM